MRHRQMLWRCGGWWSEAEAHREDQDEKTDKGFGFERDGKIRRLANRDLCGRMKAVQRGESEHCGDEDELRGKQASPERVQSLGCCGTVQDQGRACRDQ